MVDSGLLYDILKLLASNFKPIDVELILACLRSIGFRLRKDDPIELKALIILIQQKATASKTSTTNRYGSNLTTHYHTFFTIIAIMYVSVPK